MRHAVAVTNGTIALVAAMQALGLEPGDEVVTSPFTFVATLNAILECGAVARFADIDPRTFTVDADAVADAITPRTRALMPVHIYGQAADMARIAPLAADRGLVVVEDAAQAHGATVDGRAVGSFGVGCFSFYATKNVTSGEGGMITTDDDLLADTLRVLRNEGMRARYEYERAGHNYRLTDVQAAIAIPQLAHLAESNERRRANAARLDEGLAGIPGLLTPLVAPGRTHVFHQYTVRVTPDVSSEPRRARRPARRARHRDGRLLPACRARLRLLPIASARGRDTGSGGGARTREKCCRCPCIRRSRSNDVDRVVEVVRSSAG